METNNKGGILDQIKEANSKDVEEEDKSLKEKLLSMFKREHERACNQTRQMMRSTIV